MSIETALKDAEDEIRSVLKDIGNHAHTPKRLVAVFHRLLVEFHLEHAAPQIPEVPPVDNAHVAQGAEQFGTSVSLTSGPLEPEPSSTPTP